MWFVRAVRCVVLLLAVSAVSMGEVCAQTRLTAKDFSVVAKPQSDKQFSGRSNIRKQIPESLDAGDFYMSSKERRPLCGLVGGTAVLYEIYEDKKVAPNLLRMLARSRRERRE